MAFRLTTDQKVRFCDVGEDRHFEQHAPRACVAVELDEIKGVAD